VKRAGARKVLFGSDGPWLHPGVELAKVRALRLAPQDERKVLAGNLLRLMRPIGGAGARAARPAAVAAGPPAAEASDPWSGDPFGV
jgi:hypothetical protein